MEHEEELNFEAALAEVEAIVQELESGDTDLTQSLAQYEVGIKRLKQCHDLLQQAERRIELLSGFDADGNPVTEPFETDDALPVKAKRKSRSAKQGVRKNRSRTAREPTASESDASETSGEESDSIVDDSPGLF